MVSFANDPKIN